MLEHFQNRKFERSSSEQWVKKVTFKGVRGRLLSPEGSPPGFFRLNSSQACALSLKFCRGNSLKQKENRWPGYRKFVWLEKHFALLCFPLGASGNSAKSRRRPSSGRSPLLALWSGSPISFLSAPSPCPLCAPEQNVICVCGCEMCTT